MNAPSNSIAAQCELDAAGAPAGELVAPGILNDWYRNASEGVLNSAMPTPSPFADDEEDDPCDVDPAGTGWSADSGHSEDLQDK